MNTTLLFPRLDAKPPTEVQMKLAIAQTLSLPFAYNSPVVVLDFEVDEEGNISGRFKDAARPRVFSFEMDGESVMFRPFVRGRMDSAEDWENFSAGYTFRLDAPKKKSTDKPQCTSNTSYNCGLSCINIKKNCRKVPKDSKSKDRLKKLKQAGIEYSESTPKKANKEQLTKTQAKNLIGDGTHEKSPKNAQDYYKMMLKKGNQITIEEAENTARAIRYWSGDDGYKEIRRDQKAGRYNEDAELIAEYIKNSTPYKGEIYRGIAFKSEDEAMKWIKGKNGDGVLDNQSAHSSWTSSLGMAEEFAESYESSNTSVVIKTIKNKSGASIWGMSEFKDEEEVVVPKSAKHKVKSYKKEDGIIMVEVEEL